MPKRSQSHELILVAAEAAKLGEYAGAEAIALLADAMATSEGANIPAVSEAVREFASRMRRADLRWRKIATRANTDD